MLARVSRVRYIVCIGRDPDPPHHPPAMTTAAIAADITWMISHTISDPIQALRCWEREMAETLTDEQFDEVIALVA